MILSKEIQKKNKRKKNRTTWLKVYGFSYSFPKCNNHCHFRPPLPLFLRPKIPLYFYGCKLLVQSRMLLEWKFEKKDVLKKDKNRNNTKQKLHFGLFGLAGLSTSRKRRHQESDYEPLSTLRVFFLCVYVRVYLCFSLIQPSVQALNYAIGGHVWAYGRGRWPFRALAKKILEDIRNGQKSTWKQPIFEN